MQSAILPSGNPDGVMLSPNEVHVWWARIEAWSGDVAAALRSLLADEELLRHDALRLAVRRDEYLVTRALVRSVLSHYVAVAPTEWRFAANAHGRPHVVTPSAVGALDFNISHTRGLVVCAVGQGRRVGVDVEWRDETVEMMDVSASHFAPSEQADMLATAPDARCLRFFTYWTLKESYIKACGQGLSIALDSFAFRLPVQSPPQLCIAGAAETTSPDWRFEVLPMTRRHLAAVAFECRPLADAVRVICRPASALLHAPWRQLATMTTD